ncbi:MAG TPA: ATP-binding protein [Verrucomicrobiae bacterium]|nr:ATP-binding protein [Verrucomicrobiae bacterium]
MRHLGESMERLIGREPELRRLRAAFRKRESLLLWGPADAGKSLLIQKALAQLPESERRKCICWSGPTGRRQLIAHLVTSLYLAGDPFVRGKVRADRFSDANLARWISEQSAMRLRGILISAAQGAEYLFFLDHLGPVSHTVAQFLKEVMYRAKTPVYLAGHGYTQAEIGYAWSLYWTDEYRIPVGPLSDARARELLEFCIRDSGLESLDLSGFREELLRLSGHLPGAIVKMCAMAADPRYHFGDRVKLKLVHVDYLMRSDRFCSLASHAS